MDAWSGALFAVVTYLVFSWGMASGLIPVPTPRSKRIAAIVLVTLIGSILVGQVVLVVWSHAAR